VEKFCRSERAKVDNLAHAHCLLDTQDYRNTLRICNTYCLSTATMVARTRLSVMLHVQYIASLDVISSVNWLQLVDLMWERTATDIHTHPNGLLASSTTRRLCFALRHTCYVNQSYVNCVCGTVPVFEYVQK